MFMAGLLRHAAEITAVTNQTVNSYKRLVPGFEAPVHISWARNKTAAVWCGCRSPSAASQRHSHRVPFARPSVQPVPGVLRDACRRHARITEGYELPPEADSNLFEMSDSELVKLGIDLVPQSLSDALRVMEQSSLVHEALGEHIFEWFLRNKRSEWRAYKTHVSAFEHDRYLRAL